VNGRRRALVVEIDPAGLMWVKSSVSGDSNIGGDCVEVAVAANDVLVRCSHSGPRLRCSAKG
jgi:hypothetical protein